MDGSMFDGVGQAITVMMLMLLVSVPLGIWKAVEIIIWLFRNVSISLGD